MAENEETYLRQCLEQNICPVCKSPIKEKFGSGQFKDGVFCSLDCYAKMERSFVVAKTSRAIEKGEIG